MSEQIRAFIAVDLDKPIKNLIADIQNHLSESECLVKWVAPQSAHITLKFLGDIEEQTIPAIKEYLEKASSSIVPTHFDAIRVGAFPNTDFPRIIWLGIEEDGTISQLAEKIEQALVPLGFAKEDRKFTPHITIGRLSSTKNSRKLSQLLQDFPTLKPIKQPFDHVSLYQSTLTSQGPIYERLLRIPFPIKEINIA
ncbi:MAG TPA: RNA 2',3'-cyclic phosphodiesterase [Candidatus Omnitrophota bacterium]|nr:RNA 2',3'-cyclic phosphodiesterase [Candidatus Omnitrophota bacterium]